MRKTAAFAIGLLTVAIFIESSATAQTPTTAAQHPQQYRHYEGPPVTLTALLQEAAEKNPELIALRQQIDVLRHRPAQERGLNPPMAEAQIWQWPINSINPANTNMYMFMVRQELPGRGKTSAADRCCGKGHRAGRERCHGPRATDRQRDQTGVRDSLHCA